jgi:curli production assembly/transport component CsgG
MREMAPEFTSSSIVDITGSAKDPVTEPARLVEATKTGLVLDGLPPPKQKLDVSLYNFPDLTGQNKSNDNFAEFSRAVTQGGTPS